jgi:hypothetical protein
MPLLIPASVNYQSNITVLPSFSQDEPAEGRKQIACEILWGTMGGSAKCVGLNVYAQGGAVQGFSQISTLKVDNSQSGADVTFIFPDTVETIVIPGGTPLAVVPVFSNSLQFYVSAPNAVASDVTRFILMNYLLEPANVDITQSATFASSSATQATSAGGVTQLIPAGVNGTLELLSIGFCLSNFVASNLLGTMTIADGAGNTFINAYKVTSSTYTPLSIGNTNIRFQNGLTLTFANISWGATVSWINAVLTYKQP